MSRYDFTPSETETDYVAVPLYRHDGSIRTWTLVDLIDLIVIKERRWCVGVKDSVCSKSKEGKTLYLHREILGLPTPSDGREGDHKNRNRLDNRRSNLRIVPQSGNRQNRPSVSGSTSRYRGVYWNREMKRWRASVRTGGQLHHIGYFDNEEDAARAAREARQRLMPYAVD